MSMCISGIYVGVYLRVRVRTCEYRRVLVHIYAYLFVSVRVYTAFAKAYIELTFRKMNEGPRDPKSFGIWWN